MPIIESAKKKMRQDEKRTARNRAAKRKMKESIKKAKKSPTPVSIKKAYSAIDIAFKKNIIHKNKAARLKSGVVKNAKAKTTTQKAKTQK